MNTASNVYPLSSPQMGIFTECMSGKALYNIPMMLRLDRSIDEHRLCRACEAAVKAHPCMDIRISLDDSDTPVQYLSGQEFHTEPEYMSDEELTVEKDSFVKPFDLLSDRLFRIRVIVTENSTVLLTDIHHIIIDGTSMGIFLKDIERAYNGGSLEEEEVTAFDLALAEKNAPAQAVENARRYYLDTFSGVETDPLPVPDAQGGEYGFGEYEQAMTFADREIKAFCRVHGIGRSVLANAAFGVLTAGYAAADEAIFATIYNGRKSPLTSRTVTMMVKTLPVHIKLINGQSTADMLTDLAAQMKASKDNDIYPFAEICRETGVTGDLIFAYQGDSWKTVDFLGQHCENIVLPAAATGAKLTAELFKNGDSFTLKIEYCRDLYSKGFIQTLARAYDNVLTGLLTADTVDNVSLADEGIISVLDSFNDTSVPYDDTQTVVSLFRAAARTYPGNTAVIYENDSITYAELDSLSDKIGAYIASKGLGKGDAVSVLIPRGIYQAAASLGVLKAGCAYQPLDATYPPERLSFMAKDADAKLIITTEELKGLVSGYEGEYLYLSHIPSLPEGKAVCDISPADPFILLYTSGSTGVPKGVVLTHGNLVCFIDWYIRFYGVTPDDRVGQYASYGFDACMMDMYPALCSGGAVCIVPEDMRLDIMAMDKYYTDNRVSLAFFTTQVGRQFVTETRDPYLRAVSTGGEKLASMEPPERPILYNIYGPTECTIIATWYRVSGGEENIPIGRPLDNVKCYVVDACGRRVPPGALGELVIAGPHVGAGYLNRPEKTAEVFIDNPFEGGAYSRAYRTGDIVRYRPDGEIEFIGRRDGQVKVHGFRIELSEVEAVIREFEGIRNAAVVARDLGAEGKAVAAYIVSDREIDIKALSAFILERKPPYMLPSSIMQIDAIPLNQNGKVNRKALPEPVIQTHEEEPHTDNALETELKAIIGEILQNGDIPVNTPLEYAGLTSISTIRLSSALYKRFDINIPVKAFRGITLLGLENIILEKWLSGEKSEDTSAEIQPSSPLSAAQTGIYIECMKDPESTAYNIPMAVEFDRDMNTNALIAAVKAVVKAHPSMNVRFDLENGEIRAIREDISLDIPVIETDESAFRSALSRQSVAFRLSSAPLYRFAVIRTEKSVYLFSDIHHLIFDGFSEDVFIKELSAVLSGGTPRGERDYFEFVRESGAALERDEQRYREYFGTLLADFESATELPPDLPARDTQGKKAYAYGTFDQSAADSICRRLGISEAAFFLAALDYTLARLTASDRVYISTISNGRADVRFADTIGMFVNTIPLAAALCDGTADDFIKQVAGGLAGAVAHEGYPFARVAAEWGYTVNVMYEYQRGIINDTKAPHMKGAEVIEPDTSKFPVAVRIIDREGKGAIECEYNDAMYSPECIRRFIRSLEITAEKLAAGGRLRSISLIDRKREQQLDTFRSRPEIPAIPEGTLFHSGVERTAVEHPERTALIACDGTYTYRQLDENANRVANALIGKGVNKGDRVVLLLPRISGMFFAIYGVLKAGAAYIPCDPAYPAERIRHIIDDSHAALVITTGDRLRGFTDRPAADIEALLAEENTSKPDIHITQDDLCYLIYTSGSTGKPKGVMIRHGGAVNYVYNTPGNILPNAMTERGRVLTAITTFSFDFSVKEWAMPLFNGLTVSVASDDETNDAKKLAARIKATHTDMFGSTPSRLMTLLASPEFSDAFENVKIVICGGEKYPEQLLSALKQGRSDRLIFNTYGPTEVTVSCNTAELSGQDSVNAGRPLPGVVEYIVDTDGNEIPAGIVGELYIGGAGVAAGYNGLPEMTAEKFISYKGMRVYRSGDYARWTEDGFIEVLGRKDNQIKLRGLRIELDEVDAVLGAVSGIKRTAVKIEKLNGIEHLCAWFTADHKIDIGELKKELGKTLTSYMVPTAYMQLDEMPFTPNGKLDLKNLPTPELYRSKDSQKPTTKAEKLFCGIFSQLLHAEDVGVNESFFDLGGTSLLVTNVVIEAGKAGYSITFADVFDNPTPRQLAALAEGGSTSQPRKDDDIAGYDYTAINKLLAGNNIDAFKNGKCRDIGNVLLTGGSGYLGIHILHELIENETGLIYLLLRSKGELSAAERIVRMYFYYFDQNITELLGKRIFVTEGDVTDKNLAGKFEGVQLDTVINCAAVVKHFSNSTIIEDVNVGGTVNLIGLCLEKGATLVQTSTMSVRQSAYRDMIPADFAPTEQDLWFGQDLSNKYVHSKFLAERAVLEAAASKGLKAKIMRYGNLSARSYDGEFQINFSANSAMGRLRAYAMLGCITFEQMASTMEFSPIDGAAKATVQLCRTPDECVLFHTVNDQNISMAGVLRELAACGYKVRGVESDVFADAFAKAQSDPEKASELTAIMAYAKSPDGREMVTFPKTCGYTMQVLYRMGYMWPSTTWDYIRRFVNALAGLGFFD